MNVAIVSDREGWTGWPGHDRGSFVLRRPILQTRGFKIPFTPQR